MAKSNYPQSQLDEIEPGKVQEIVTSLKELHDRGKPKTDTEIEQRIDDFFSFCQNSSIRPGIESLCMSLHISRTTLFNWANGIGCSRVCQEYIQSAKAFIAAYLEQALLCGKISPPSGIFIAKNWLGYKDTVSLEDATPKEDARPILSADELPRLIAERYGTTVEEMESRGLPEPPEDDISELPRLGGD